MRILGGKLTPSLKERALPDERTHRIEPCNLASYFRAGTHVRIVQNEAQATRPWHPTQARETAGALHLQFLAPLGNLSNARTEMRWLQTIEWLRDEPEPALTDGEMRRLATCLVRGELGLQHWLVGIKDIGCGSEVVSGT